MTCADLQSFIQLLSREGELVEINAEVDPHLEAAEIHRRVIENAGPAILFKNIKGADFPLVTNLFGTYKRVELAFGKRPQELIEELVKLPEELMPPSISKLWQHKNTFFSLAQSLGISKKRGVPVTEVCEKSPRLTRLPLLTTWEEDGGPFITLPLVYTEHPETGVSNLGMYRIQRYDDDTTGLHFQIGKGGGFHLAEAERLNRPLPVNIAIGGPPALILAAIAPLPENVPELLLAGILQGKRMTLGKNPFGPLPVAGNAEFVLVGEARPHERRPEGPFGDHYGYYSLKHDYPVFHCQGLLRRKNAICAATVVGKPRQEDYFIGEYLQKLLSPLFPLVMPAVKDLWSYGETGFHSLAAAVVKQRYKREAMVSAFRILGEGQLALTKFLLVVDKEQDLSSFRGVLEYVLARADFQTDLYIFSNLSMDTLDYTGPKVNEGSKGVLLGSGAEIRQLPDSFHGELPRGVTAAQPFCKGCLVVQGTSFSEQRDLAEVLSKSESLTNWPLVSLVDDVEKCCASEMDFLWTTFTRFEPGADIYARKSIIRNHIAYEMPIIIDARMKPDYPAELICDPATEKLVSERWKEYFPLTRL